MKPPLHRPRWTVWAEVVSVLAAAIAIIVVYWPSPGPGTPFGTFSAQRVVTQQPIPVSYGYVDVEATKCYLRPFIGGGAYQWVADGGERLVIASPVGAVPATHFDAGCKRRIYADPIPPLVAAAVRGRGLVHWHIEGVNLAVGAHGQNEWAKTWATGVFALSPK